MKLKGHYIDPRRVAPLAIIALFMFVTIGHVANFTGSFEQERWQWLGLLYAIAVDLSIVICSQFTKWKTTRLWAWVGYFVFVAASGVMNVAAIGPQTFAAWVYATFPTAAISLLGFLYGQVDKLASGKEQRIMHRISGNGAKAVPAPTKVETHDAKPVASIVHPVCQECGEVVASGNMGSHRRWHCAGNGANGGEAVAETVSVAKTESVPG